MKVETDIELVENYFLSQIEMTNKKMQKMLYYAYAWYIASNNDSDDIQRVLFAEQPEAWIHGPVFPSAYERFKAWGREMIPRVDEAPEMSLDLRNFLDEIIRVFGGYDGDQLELMTHNEYPWKNARSNLDKTLPSTNLIQLSDIYNFYSNL